MLTCRSPGMLLLGGAQFFIFSSSVGFVGAAFFFYRQQVQQAFQAFDDYPELMRLHLMMNFPLMQWQKLNLHPDAIAKERQKIERSSAFTSMLASAYQTASPTIDVSFEGS
jgi:hypothetical protein